MPPSSSRPAQRQAPKKGAKGAGKESAVRKRAQNRISQQCLREKNLAYVRSLESTVALLQSAVASSDSGASSGGDRYAAILEAHSKQMRENQRLREAVLRMRKKLLSLSNAAAAAADDEIFSSILGETLGSESEGESPDAEGEVGDEVDAQGSHRGLDNAQDGMEESGVAADPSLSNPENAEAVDLSGSPFRDYVNSSSPGNLDAMLLPGMEAPPTLELALGLMLPSPPRAILNLHNEPVVVTSGVVLGTKLLNACQQCLCRAGASFSAAAGMPDDFGQQLLAAATHFVSCCLGLEQYIYGVNGARYIEKVLGWRLGLASRDGVPSPFRPTPLQSHDQTHYWGIDMFSWPDVRDQLVLLEQEASQQKQLDWDDLIRDLLLHSVIEPPQKQGVAVSVLDVFHNQILRRENRPPTESTAAAAAAETVSKATCNFLNDPSWVLFTGHFPGDYGGAYAYPYSDPVEQAFVAELEQRMQALATSSSLLSSSTKGPTSPGRCQPSDVAVFLGLDNVIEWKLSKQFAEKYPFLDCSAVVSPCDLAPSSAVFCW